MIEVKKAWGRETWLVNCDEYCGKFLHLNSGAQCSYHYHPIKKETFHSLEGLVALTVNGRNYILTPATTPQTIFPGDKHCFRGLTKARILEISTHHDDGDVVRANKSKGGE